MKNFLWLMLISPLAWAEDPYWLEGKTDQVYDIQVWRSESCGCCKAWIEHLEDHEFRVLDTPVDNLNAVKDQYQIPQGARSCHTALVNGLLVEGHVPAQDIKKALEQGEVELLAVPAMPSGSPGMDFPGSRKDDFAVIAKNGDQVWKFNDYQNY